MHRYSVLQQHAEANGVDGVDALDTASHSHKSGYHDDSDEVRLFLFEGWSRSTEKKVILLLFMIKIQLRQRRV